MRLGRCTLIAFALLGCSAEADGDGAMDDAVTDDAVTDDVDGATPGSDAARACIADNPPAEPFDLGDVVVPSRAPGSSGPVAEPPTAATIASECVASGGTGCDASRFISREAASCLARADEFEAGLEPWGIALVYHHRQDRVVWNVRNVTSDRGAAGSSGGALTIDATEGLILERLGWAVIP